MSGEMTGAMTREPFDLLTFPLDGLRLIEASAGTGKTFSLAGLYLRLLLEKQVAVRDILVMTFTKAATQELRERIRARITVAARIAADPDHAEAGNAEHDIAVRLIAAAEQQESRARIAQRLRDAAARMDDATIATIHGFAQQAAQENAFESALPFDRGTQVDDPGLLLQAVTDYWRSQVLGHAPEPARAFTDLWPKPDALYEDLQPGLERPYLDIRHGSPGSLAALWERAGNLWEREHRALHELLCTAVDGNHLLKNKPLRQAIEASGGVDALMSRVAAGLAGSAAGHPALPAWIADLASDDGVARSVKKASLKKIRPQDLELVQALAALAPAGRIAALEHAFSTVRGSIERRKRDGRLFSFADMIEMLHSAVTHPDRGPELARALRRAWPYALVDEFQDTDPLQYEILRAIYRNPEAGETPGSLIMIGDPKQAIFAFRGGDVFAYLQAARDADGRYDLAVNYRSSQGVLDGIDALFRGPAAATAPGEFLVPDIRFHPVQSGRPADSPTLVRDGQRLTPVTVWQLPDDANKADDARTRLVDATVAGIHALLDPEQGARSRDQSGHETPVRPNDIAVLVSRNRDAADVQRALARRGIGAVCLQPDSVFASSEATDLLYFLRAADSSARPEAVRAALTTPLFGLRMADLVTLSEDEVAWHRHAGVFQDAHEIWRTRGLLAMLEPAFQAAAPRVLGLEDGERRMTNYLQLAELLAQAETETFGFGGLIHWLAHQIAHPEPYAEVDAQQLKLESDDELVRITTVHRAKGLEYSIVFAPFTPFLGARDQKPPLIYHDDAGKAWLDFSVDGDGRPLANGESRAESLRLLYVALTRARQACYFAWGPVNGAQNSALGWLLHAGDGIEPGAVANQPRSPGPATSEVVTRRLQEYAARANGAVRVCELPEPLQAGLRVAPGAAPQGNARTDLPRRRADWSVTSFSRLVAGGKHRTADSGADDEVLELPATTVPIPVEPQPLEHPIALRGPAFGTAVHQLLERIDDPAAWPAPGERPQAAHLDRAVRCLLSAGLPLGEGPDRNALLDAVCRLVARTLHTPLPGIGPLAAVPPSRRLVEMEFFLALGGEGIGHLVEVLNAHGYPINLGSERAQQTLNGLMQGYIDLTVEANGRYWVVDYKTNDLGGDRSDYQGDALARAVRYGHYDLQYLIYLVALHRHLRHTLPGYDPEQHLGGAQYLFLRGLDGSGSRGVFVDTPPAALINALDAVFGGLPAAEAAGS